jgi:hypothetical protein
VCLRCEALPHAGHLEQQRSALSSNARRCLHADARIRPTRMPAEQGAEAALDLGGAWSE